MVHPFQTATTRGLRTTGLKYDKDMLRNYTQVSNKYRTIRRQPDALFSSRIVQTLLNKFTKTGAKVRARRSISRAFLAYRTAVWKPRVYCAMLSMLGSLQSPFSLSGKRRGGIVYMVPVPVRRNKRDTQAIHSFYTAVQERGERSFAARYLFVLEDIGGAETSLYLRQRDQQFSGIYGERTNLDYR
jgi:ribosomal protein S7